MVHQAILAADAGADRYILAVLDRFTMPRVMQGLPVPDARAHLPWRIPLELTMGDKEKARCHDEFDFAGDTRAQLFSMSRDLVTVTMDRLRFGGGSRNHSGFGIAARNSKGCLVSQKITNNRGYIQVAPTVFGHRNVKGEGQPRVMMQLGHRVALLEIGDRRPRFNALDAAGRPGTIRGVMEEDELDISHLCHTNGCINTDHMVFEAGDRNNRRRTCKQRNVCCCGYSPACILWRT